MKNLAYLTAGMLLMLSSYASAKSLKAIMSYKTFYNAEKGPYIETYLSVAGSSVEYSKLENGKYQGKIEVTLAFKLNNEAKHFDKYNLLSPEVDDPAKAAFNFIDEQRVQLNNGKYVMEISIADKNTDSKPFTSTEQINIEYYPNIVSVSDIELVDTFTKSEGTTMLTKNGFEIVPYVNNFYGEGMNSLKFYAEIYNVEKVTGNEPFLISYFIQSLETKRVIEKFRSFKKESPKNLNVLLAEFPIAELPSGNYSLVVEVRNNKNDIIAFKDVPFQRSTGKVVYDGTTADASNTFAGQYLNKDSLADMILSLRPISNGNETKFEDNQVKIADVKMMQNFLYDFWAKRSPDNPELAWMEYNKEVQKVNADFKVTNKRGYETDRGRVYLQYGPPQTMDKEYRELSNYPYEIWHYYKIGSQTNRKFVFWNTDLITNDFTLLHSDAQGEVVEPQWEMKLRKRDFQTNDLDHNINMDGLGNKANQNFNNPR